MRIFPILTLLPLVAVAQAQTSGVATLSFRNSGAVPGKTVHGIANALKFVSLVEMSQTIAKGQHPVGPQMVEMQLTLQAPEAEKRLEKALASHDPVSKAVIYQIGKKSHKIAIQGARLGAVYRHPNGTALDITLYYTTAQVTRS